MKKKFISIICLVLMFISTSEIVRANGSAAISVSQTNLKVGGTASISISIPDVQQGMLEFEATSTGSVSINSPGINSILTGSTSITVRANSAGTGSVTLSGYGIGSDRTEYTISRTITFNVTNPTTTTPTNPTTPTIPTKPTTPNKTPEQLAKEKEEAEKAAKETAAKTPLIGEVKLFSDSVKMYNDVLNVVVPEFDKWDYGFTLPKRIDKVFLNVTPLDSNTVVTFDEKLDFNELGANEHTFEIRAKLGDIEQVIMYKVSMDTTEAPKIEHEGSQFTSFDDEILDKFLVETGKFEKLSFKNAQDIEVSYYKIGSINLLPVIDENNKAKWFMLDDNFVLTKSVIVLFDTANRPFLIFDAPEDLKVKTVQGVAYLDASLEIPEILNSIDDSITWDNAIKSWKIESGSILYGMDDTGKEGNFYLDEQGNISFAVVTYDSETSVDYKTWAYVSSALSVVLLVSFASYVFVNVRHKKIKI